MSMPAWFQANGEVEKRQIKSQIKALRIPQEEKNSSEAVILAVFKAILAITLRCFICMTIVSISYLR